MVDASLPVPCFTSGLTRQPPLDGFGLDEDSFDFRFLPADLSFKTINSSFEIFDSQIHIKAQRNSKQNLLRTKLHGEEIAHFLNRGLGSNKLLHSLNLSTVRSFP